MDSVEENPDIGKIDDIFVTFALDVYTQENTSIEYLQAFFGLLEKESQILRPQYTTLSYYHAWRTNGTAEIGPSYYFKVESDEYNVEIAYDFIEQSGIQSGIQVFKEDGVTPDVGGSRSYVLTGNNSYGLASGPTTPTGTYTGNLIVFVTQLTESTWHITVVYGLEQKTIVREASIIVSTLNIDFDEGAETGFHIPITDEILDGFSGKKESLILYDGLHLIIYGIEVTVVKWYQTTAFAIILTIAAVVIAVLTNQYQLILEAATLWDAAVLIGQQVLIGYAISEGVQYLAKELGVLGAIIAAIAMVYLSSQYGKGAKSIKGLPFVDEVILAVNTLVEGLETVLEEAFKELQQEALEFTKQADEAQEELEKAKDLLGSSGIQLYDPLYEVSRPSINTSMSPSQFYDLKIHTPNPGVLAIGALTVYVDNALKLPTVTESTAPLLNS